MDKEDKKPQEEQKKNKKIINARFLFYGFLALLFGITISRKLWQGEALYIAVTVVTLVAVIVGLCFTKRFKMLVMILCLFFAGNGLYFAGIASFEGRTYEGDCVVMGRVQDDLISGSGSYKCTLDNVYINGEKEKNISLIIVKDYQNKLSIKPGDTIIFESDIANVRLFDLGSFNLSYHRNNTPYTASVFANEVVHADIENRLRYDEVIRLKTRQILHENMSDDNAEIAFAMLFGDKNEVDSLIKADYREAGIIHILAVSGLHVGFLVALLYFLLKRCNRYIRFSVLLFVLVLYNILCGFAPSVLRASIMAIVLLIAKLSGREYDSLSSLSLAGFLIVLPNPLSALDNGFLMSYFCVAAIFLLYKKLQNLFYKFMQKKIASYVALSISAQIGILPWTAEFFSNFNFLSVFANLLVVPLFAIVFPILFVLFVLSLIMPFLGKLFIGIDGVIYAINFIAKIFANTSLKVPLKPLPIVFNILLCLGLFALSSFLMVSRRLRAVAVAFIVFASSITMVVASYGTLRKNIIAYTNYGGAGVIYAVNDEGESLLLCNEFLQNPFNEYAHIRGIKQIDYIITTAGVFDNKFIDKFSVKGIAYPESMTINDSFVEIEEEKPYKLGKFSFRYIFFDDKVAGVEFYVNNFKNFFASENSLSYNNRERLKGYLQKANNAFNFLNKLSISLPESQSKNFYTYKRPYADYSIQNNGNMQIDLKDTKWTLRCID